MAKLLTTKQVRNIMRINGADSYGMYTNKTAGHKGNLRRVKAYVRGNHKMVTALIDACGAENVNITDGSEYFGWPGVTVKCVLG